jgi:hypothetical protein
MTYSILWGPAALWTFYSLPMHSAFIVDRTVILFATTGEGHVEWVAPHHRLRAGMHELALHIDREARTIAVLFVYRVRPLP